MVGGAQIYSLAVFENNLFNEILITQRFSIMSAKLGRGQVVGVMVITPTLENIWGASFMSFAECCPDERNRILVSPLHRQTPLAPTLRMI